MVSSRTKAVNDKNITRASIGAGSRLRVGYVSANAEDSRYNEITNNGVKKSITGMDIAVRPSSRKVDNGRMSWGGRRCIGLDGRGRCN